MRALLIVATALPFLCGSAAFAQVETVTPPLGVTSSLGAVPGVPVGPNGLQVGASTTASSMPNGVTGTITVPNTSTGAAPCSTLANSPLGTFGSPTTYDGGGMAMANGSTMPVTAATSGGVVPPETSTSSGISMSTAISPTSGETISSAMPETSGLTGMCGSGASSITASSNPTSTSPATSSGGTGAGIPLGSYEIGNLGVSAAQ